MHNECCIATENTMSNLSLSAFRPVESREVASLSARYITTVVIAMTGLLTLAPIAVYFAQ